MVLLTQLKRQSGYCLEAFLFQRQPIRAPRLQDGQRPFPFVFKTSVCRKTADKEGLALFRHIQNVLIEGEKESLLCRCDHGSIHGLEMIHVQQKARP